MSRSVALSGQRTVLGLKITGTDGGDVRVDFPPGERSTFHVELSRRANN